MKLNYDAKSTMVAQGWRKGGARVAQRNFYNVYYGTIVLLRHGARLRKMAQDGANYSYMT
jgi:hypothetical protein